MADLPPQGPPPSPPESENPSRGSRPVPRWRLPLLLVALAGTAATGVVLSLDRLAAHTYGRLQSGLERDLGQALGQPVSLGPYRGLSWLGLRLGPSQVRPLPSHPSGVEMAGIALSLDPLASLRRRLPVLEVNLQGVEANLRPNAEGSYWRLPDFDPTETPERLVARVRLPQPALVALERDGREAQLALRGTVVVEPHRFRASALLGLRPLGPGTAAAGALQVRGGGNWRSDQWQAQISSRDVDLQWPADLLGLGGELEGRVDGQLQLAWGDREPDCQGDLQVRQLSWRAQPGQPALSLERPLLRCQGRELTLASSRWRWAERSGQVGLRALWEPSGLRLEQLQLSSGRSWLWARGALTPNPVLTGDWQLDPADLPLPEGVDPALVGSQLRGSLQLAGSWSEPLISTRVSQASNALLGPWQAQLRWRDQRLLLDRFTSDHLSGRGSLPLTLAGGEGLRTGLLDLRLQLQRYPLTRLGPLLGADLQGVADADGTIRGPLSGLTPEFQLRLEQPGAGPLLVAETWEGTWLGDPAGGGRLRMASRGDAPPGRLEARLDRAWVPVALSLERNDGRLELEGSPRAYRWTASDFPLVGLQLALGSEGQWRPLRGGLSGAGVLELQPLAFQGRVELDQPSLLGVPARRVVLDGSYRDRQYQASGAITAEGGGELDLEWSGRWRGPYVARFRGQDLDDGLVRRLLEAWPRWRGEPGIDPGSAADLGTLMIDTMGGTVDDLLVALNRAHERLREALADQRELLTPAQRLERVSARFDLDLELSGPSLADTRIDGSAEGYVWFPGQDRDQARSGEPLRLELNGPVQMGSGSFGFSGVPLSLVALFTPVPDELRGRVSSTGTYTLGAEPALALELALDDAALGDTEIALRRGSVQLEGNALALDLALRAAGADSGIDLAGVVPLDPSEEGIELRVTSRDDGLIFLSRLAQPTLVWEEGSADLQLLVRGSLDRPIANGFLRIQNGQLALLDQEVEDLQATLLFDFEQLLLQEFTARVGGDGRISGSGSLGLFSPQRAAGGEPARLSLAIEGLPYRSPRLNTDVNGELTVGGSLIALQLGGELVLAKGSLNVQPGRLASEENGAQSVAAVEELAEQNWDFEQPLVLLGPELEARTGEDLRALVPAVGFLALDGLRINLGQDFHVVVPQLADFRTSGTLRLDGPVGPDIEARGVVKLERGRLNLFTTNFFLDRNAPNVAVFTPSLGLVPFLDITLRSRVSDSLTAGGVVSGSAATSPYAPSLAQQQNGFTSFSQLNLVQVFLSVSGPADRIAENISLRSTPALPQDRLLALIGGNSLAGLEGSAAGAALATALGQTLLSPVLGTLGEVFDERVSFALYPTFVSQTVSNRSQRRSRQVPPVLVLAAEVGVDVSEQFNFSVLAAPNRTDVPPQFNLTWRASDLVNVQGSVDTEGAWQTQLQVFFRF